VLLPVAGQLPTVSVAVFLYYTTVSHPAATIFSQKKPPPRPQQTIRENLYCDSTQETGFKNEQYVEK